MIKPEEMNIIIKLLEKEGENPNLLKKLQLMREITTVSEESHSKIQELNKQLQQI